MSRILRRPMFRGGRVDSRGTGIASGLGYAGGGSVNTPKRGLVNEPGGYGGEKWTAPVDAGLLSQADKIQNWLTPEYLEKQFRKEYYLDEDQIDYIPDPAMMGMQGMTTTMYGGDPDIIEGSKFDRTRNQILENQGNYDFLFNKWVADNYGKQITSQGEILDAIGDTATKLFTPRKLPNETEGNLNEEETRAAFEERIRRENAEELQALIDSQLSKGTPEEEIEKNKKIFQKAYGSGVADDASAMLLNFAGKALKPEATVKSAFGEFFEGEGKRPSERKKYKDAATTAAINAYLTGQTSFKKFEDQLALTKAGVDYQLSAKQPKTLNEAFTYFLKTGDDATDPGIMSQSVEAIYGEGSFAGKLLEDQNKLIVGKVYYADDPNNKINKVLFLIDESGNPNPIKTVYK